MDTTFRCGRLPVRAIALLLLSVGSALAGWRSEGPFLASVNDVAFDPASPGTVYAATAGGGVWRSDDGGASWTLPGSDLTRRSVTWVQVDPAAAGTVWAGVKASGGPGLWRSLDRGKTWQVVKVDRFSSALDQRLAFAPGKPQTMLVPATNLHYRSSDGGKTWSSFRVPGQDVYAIAFHPGDPRIVFAGGRGSGLGFSRSEDGGQTWKSTGQGLPAKSFKELVAAPTTPPTLYAILGFGEGYLSKDLGDTWSPLPLGLTGTKEAWSLGVDPFDPDVLFSATEAGLRRSDDGGQSWSDADRGLGSYLCRRVAFHPKQPRVMLAASSGTGVYRTSDAGETWTSSGQGMSAGITEKLFAGPDGTLYAVMNVGTFRKAPGGAFTELGSPFAGDGGEGAKVDGFVFDGASPKVVYAHRASTCWRSTDGGSSWREMERPEPSMRDMMKGRLDEPQFRSLAQDPSDAKILYAGAWSNDEPGTAVFRTRDGGKGWEPSGQGLPGETIQILRAPAPGVVYAATREAVFATRDGGRSWAAAAGLPGAAIRDMAADPSAPDRVYAATEKGLFVSGDGGKSFAAAGPGIEGSDVDAVATAGSRTFAGSIEGVFLSEDGGATFRPFGGVLPVADVRALAVGGGRLHAGTHGGSVFSIELP